MSEPTRHSDREIMREAKRSCYALIDINVGGDEGGDLYVSVRNWSQEDKDRFAAACMALARRIVKGLPDEDESR